MQSKVVKIIHFYFHFVCLEYRHLTRTGNAFSFYLLMKSKNMLGIQYRNLYLALQVLTRMHNMQRDTYKVFGSPRRTLMMTYIDIHKGAIYIVISIPAKRAI